MKLAKHLGVSYPTIEKLKIDLGSGNRYLLRVAQAAHQPMQELLVSSIYDQFVVFEVPNGKGGRSYLWLSYEQVEYPPYSIACRAIAATDAQKLFPDDTKKRKDRQEKIEKQRQEYIEEHWRDFYDGMVATMAEWQAQQEKPPPFYLNEAALEQAVRHQCAVTFNGEKAICACVQLGNMEPCRFAIDRLRSTIREYLVADRNGFKAEPSTWFATQQRTRQQERRRRQDADRR